MQGLVADATAAATTAEAFADQLTTTELIASSATFSPNTNVTTKGYTTSGDGGAGSWVQNGVTGQTVSQSPAQLGNALLNDALGNQWALVGSGSGCDPLAFGAISGVESTLSIQAAANSTKMLSFSPDAIYVINRGIIVKSGTLVSGNNSTLKADAAYANTLPLKYMIYNENHASETIIDKDITVENLNFDYDTITSGDGYHALYLRSVLRPICTLSTFNNGSNGTAFLKCSAGIVSHNKAFNVRNCGFDMWDSSSDGQMISNYVDSNGSGNQGIQYTADGTAGIGTSSRALIAFNTVNGVAADPGVSGIIINSLAIGSAVVAADIIYNVVSDCQISIVANGLVSDVLIESNKVYRSLNTSYLVNTNTSGSPSQVRMLNNGVFDPVLTSEPIKVKAGTGHLVTGNYTNSGLTPAYNFAMLLESDNCVVKDNAFVDGTAGYINNTSTGSSIGKPFETGTYTPVFDFGGDETGFAYSVQNGYYSITNDTCTVEVNLTISSKGTGTGALGVSLPFRPINPAFAGSVGTVANFQATSGAIYVNAGFSLGARGQILKETANGNGNVLAADIGTNMSISMSFSYRII
tara:strand:- start:197 stop:1939 length:1743 start_codon:yes stop_codon:yes gene_type:complete